MIYFVEMEARRINAIGSFYLKSDEIEADTPEEAIAKFRERYKENYDIRFPSRCYRLASDFVPTHRYLNIHTGRYEKVSFLRYYGLCNAIVLANDGQEHEVGRAFLEKL